MAGNSKKAVVYAFFANFTIAILKFITAFLSGSKAMLAEGFHSAADSINQLFLLLGLRLSGKQATKKHRYGFGKERYFWSFIVALGIFLIGGVVAIYEGIHKVIESSHEEFQVQSVDILGFSINMSMLSLLVLGFSILLEGYSCKVALEEFRKSSQGKSWWEAVDDARDTTLVTIVFEDLAALFGLVLAFVGITVTYLTENVIWDGIFSIAIGVLLVVVAGFISRITKSLLIGMGMTPEQREEVIKQVSALPVVEKLITMSSVYFGPDFLLVNMKIDFQDNLDLKGLEQAINEVEKTVRNVLPAEDVYVEADTFRKTLRKLEKHAKDPNPIP